jgi:hypothetical protein
MRSTTDLIDDSDVLRRLASPGLPELVVAGRTAENAERADALLDLVARSLRARGLPALGEPVAVDALDGRGEGARLPPLIALLEVWDQRDGPPGSGGGTWQVVSCDRAGLFPWQDGYDLRREPQPLLGPLPDAVWAGF